MTRGPFIKNWLALQTEAERPFTHFGAELPPADIDLAQACRRKVIAPEGDPEVSDYQDYAVKARNLTRSFAGAPEIALINAKLIVLLRRRDPPAHIAPLFQSIWALHHAALVKALSIRWLVSSAQTMADFGATETQRRVAGELSVLCGMVKLYETERLFSGRGPSDLFSFGRATAPDGLALDFEPYSLAQGDLDRSLITRIWRLATQDEVAAAVAIPILKALIADDRAVIRRLRQMRALKREMRAQPQ